MAAKAGHIDSIDVRRNPNQPTGPATSLDTRSKHSRPTSAVRGQGGIHKEMNGVKNRDVSGS